MSTLKYCLNTGEEKVKAILNRHKKHMHQAITETLDKGWQNWSAEEAKLQLLFADHENRKK